MKNSAQRAIVERKGTLEWFGMRSHMKLKARNFFLCTTLPAAGFTITAQADVHLGIGIAVAPPIVVAPPVYYTPPPVYYAPPSPPVYYGPGIVVGAWDGRDWRDHRGHDERWRNDRWHDHRDHHR
jgi:hypothetical protein